MHNSLLNQDTQHKAAASAAQIEAAQALLKLDAQAEQLAV